MPKGPATSIPDQDARKRPALNALWNAAGAYDIAPAGWQLFPAGAENGPAGIPLEATVASDLAAREFASPDGRALLYRNTASGLIWKWFDGRAVCAFARSWEDDFRAPLLDDLCWLAFAEAAFECERAQRPALGELRAAFLATLTTAERELVARLDCAGLGQDAVKERVLTVARELYRFDGRSIQTPDAALHLGVSLLGLSMRDAGEQPGREKLHIRAAGDVRIASSTRLPARLERFLEERTERKAQAERAYIERCFGPLLCPPAELEALERATCTGVHANCRLWIADGSRLPGDLAGREFRSMQASAEEQLERNRAFFAAGRRAYDSAIEKLARSLGDRLHSTSRTPERRHTFGMLDARAAWRAPALNDTAVFQKRVPIDAPDVKVDVLLDASGSRSEQQEAIAAQAYVLGSALARCRIPVRICAFSSLRDHTVLRVFCRHGDEDGIGNVMHYFAAGMNRDGLALRAMGRFMDARGDGCKRLLIVLTDGSPMDNHPMVGRMREGRERDYLGKAAVNDTAAEVRALRRVGIHVAALYQGPDDYLDHARLIYGSQLVRIHRIERMAEAAALLIASTLDE